MNKKLEIVSYHHFKHLVEEFATDNFETEDLCPMCSDNCSPVIPQDYKGSYDLALKELYANLLK